ncbi:MAG: rpoC [Chloroflexi bacterium]|nr:rpoC [Chloroflexota bacterium]
MLEVNDFNAIRISLASPEQIKSWSYGEVTKPETINYRTLKPEKDGLFCERIFGPSKDWECYCGKYKRVRYKGIICDKCGVEVARSKVRRERMGHIELASPVSHIWYFKGTPSRLSLLLDISPRELEKILYFAQYIVTEVNETERKKALERLEREEENRFAAVEQEFQEELQRLQNPEGNSKQQREEERAQRAARMNQDRDQAVESVIEAGTRLSERLQGMIGQEALADMTLEGVAEPIVEAGATVSRNHIDAITPAVQKQVQYLEQHCEQELAKLVTEAEIEARQVLSAPDIQREVQKLEDALVKKREELKVQLAERREELLNIKLFDRPPENKVREWQDAFPSVFKAGMGAEALLHIIRNLDLNALAKEMRDDIHTSAATSQRRKKAIKRLRVVEAFRKSGPQPEWMILTVLPVIPPELRPMVQLDGGRFATSDLNDLYRRVINRNNRLKRLLELQAPEIIVRNEKRMLQEACDALIDNGRRGRAVNGSGNHKLKSLSDMLKGKQGRFRQNLLGKRVDYSGRSVIVVGPELKLHQCGLPKRMALELFKPFVMRKLVERNFAHNIRSAKRVIERVRPEVWDVLEEVIKDHPVLLNRAPTLHRLGIQAFEAVLVEGSAIQLHPLVCQAFNADFDGDQMAVHIPLSRAAQMEAKTLMLSSRNLLSPANGEPMVSPTKDMVLGCYYLTVEIPGTKGDGGVFGDFWEAQRAYDAGRLALHATIYIMLSHRAVDGATDGYIKTEVGRIPVSELVTVPKSRALGLKTTVGRIIFNEALPRQIEYKNFVQDKGKLKDVVGEVYRDLGPAKTSQVADDIKRIGFQYATRSGTTIAIDDVTIPKKKYAIISEVQTEVDKLDRQYDRGLITADEQYSQRVAAWTEARDRVSKAVTEGLDKFGSIYMMATSGAAKGQFTQISQLAGMRGLMADPQGQIIALPIKSNFREGLSVLDYFISTHGARKGLADTALRTAESGYLTRRLIDVGQDVIIYTEDCGTTRGMWLAEQDSGDKLERRITGRWTAQDVVHPETGELILGTNEEITEVLSGPVADALRTIKVPQQRGLYVRSVLNCLAKRGVCRHCYGWSMATRNLVTLGEAVGIIAAESIGEPGTQLTMRTFHTGGIAGEDITQGLPRVEELFEAREPKDKAVISEIDGIVEIVRDETGQHVRVTSKRDCRDVYILPPGYEVMVANDSEVDTNQPLAKPATQGDLVAATPNAGGAVSEDTSDQVVSRHKGKIHVSGGQLTVRYEDIDTRLYQVPAVARLRVENGQKVLAGTQLTEGSIGPQDILEIQGPEAVQKYLVAEVQRVYRSQGVGINDKHVEVIVRQMLRKVKIEDAGDTELLPGELVDRFVFEDINARVLAQDGQPAISKAVLLGVTKASLNTDSFLAAASFQETTRVLTEAAISGKKDRLMGLKENVIIGKLIPAGSGLMSRRAQIAEGEAEEQLLPSMGGVAVLEGGEGDGLGGFDDGLDASAPDIFADMPDELEDEADLDLGGESDVE